MRIKQLFGMCALVVLFCIQPLTTTSTAQTPPDIEAFFPKPKYGNLAVSPSGEFLALPKHSNEKSVLLILKADTLSTVNEIDFQGNKVKFARWATNDRLLVGVTSLQQLSKRFPNVLRMYFDDVNVSRLFALDKYDRKRVMMFNSNTTLRKQSPNLTRIQNILPDDPDHILMYAFKRRWNLYKVNIKTGKDTRIELGEPQTVDFKTNRDGVPVVRYDSYNRSQYVKISARAPGEKKWVKVAKVRYKDLEFFNPIAATKDPSIYYVSARPEGYDKSAIFKYDLVSKTFLEPLSRNADVDLYSAIIDDAGNYVGSVYYDDRLVYDFTDKNLDAHIQAINSFFKKENNVIISNISANGRTWLLHVNGPQEPGSTYVYDTTTKKAKFVVSGNYELVPEDLAKTQRINYTSRDGLKLRGYLTTPAHAKSTPPPLLVMPHGGPQARDYYEYNLMAQFFASRGYQVFQPNFRGSRGFGLAFEEAGYKKWGDVMIDDITDGVQHLIKSGKTQKNRICIMGTSYGGYAALTGAYRTPDLYQCSISINGVSDLLDTIKFDIDKFNDHKTIIQQIKDTIGDPKKDREMIKAQSPIHQINKIKIPVLIIHGSADEVVPVRQSRAFHAAMEKAGKTSAYIELLETDHNLSGLDPNDEDAEDYDFAYKKTLLAVENFLAEHLKP